jgi:methyl-accepting chemotaxis protein
MFKPKSTLFSNLNIGQRLTLGFGVLIVLILLVGAVSFAAANAQTQSLEQVLVSHETGELALGLNLQLTQAQELADAFLLRWQIEGFQQAYDNYIVANQQQTQAIRDTIAEVRLVDAEDEVLDVIEQIEAKLASYDAAVALLVFHIEQRGLADTGLEGQLSAAARELETSSVISHRSEFLNTLLQMRRGEKDYLLRGSQQAVNQTARNTIQLQLQIRGLAIPDEQQQELINLSNAYLVRFMQLAGLNRQIRLDADAVHAEAQSIEPLLEIITNHEEAEATASLANLRLTQQVAQALNTSLLVLATLAGIVLAFIIRRSITRPLSEMTSVASALSAGDLNRRVSRITHDEIGLLAQTFNTMAHQIQEVVSSLESRVAARTTDLTITIEVGSLAMSIRNQEELLPKIVEFIRARFGLYYTQIYLLDEARRFAH